MRPIYKAPVQKKHTALIQKLSLLLTQAVEAQNKGDIKKAEQMYREVLKLQPNNFECWHILGIFKYQQNNYLQAAELFRKTISLNSTFAPAHCNLGLALQEQGLFEQSLSSYAQATELDPYLHDAYNNQGNVFKQLGQLDRALSCYNMALVYWPQYPEALYNVAETLKLQERWHQALRYYEFAIVARPSYVDAYNNRGLLLQFLNQVELAIQSFDKAIEFAPAYAAAHSNKSMALLLNGRFKEGWSEHEWRWNMDEFRSVNTVPQGPRLLAKDLTQDSLAGKRILIVSEQGLGDTIQFSRYLPYLLSFKAHVLLQVQEPLFDLMCQLVPAECLFKQGDHVPNFDYYCPLLSLPFVLGDLVDHIPSHKQYLHADSQRVHQWSELLGVKHKRRIGVVWSGNKHHRNDSNRSLPFETFVPYLSKLGENFEIFSLQINLSEHDSSLLQKNPFVRDLSAFIRDFGDTAALCHLMDEVVTVDTSVAHLAGALGCSTSLMLAFAPDWRWMLKRSDSLWYPSFRIYRQPGISDWSGLLDQLVSDLMGQK